MSVTIYQLQYGITQQYGILKMRFKPPFGGGQNTSINSYVSTWEINNQAAVDGGVFSFTYWNGSSTYNQRIANVSGTHTITSSGNEATKSETPYTTLTSWVNTFGYNGPNAVTTESFYAANITANAYGTVSLAQLVYEFGTSYRTSTATPNDGSSFLGWFLTGTETQVTTNDDFTVSSNVITLKRNPVSADIAVEARFSAVYLLTTASSGNGTAYIGASPSTATTGWYQVGQTVSIRATSTNELYKFSKWTVGGVDYSTSPTVSVTTGAAAATYTAVFIPVSYTLNVTSDDDNHGTVAVLLGGSLQLTQVGLTVSSGVAYADPVVNPVGVEVRATPVFGYYFTGWYIGATLESSLANYTFSMPESNVSIEARFSVLSTATITVTKTKGNAGDTADAKDQGVVSLYHLESVLDLTSAAGTATLVASLYTTLQYKLVPAPASNLYQFDGWYKTVGEAQELITTGGIYVVDGINLYVTPTTTAAIPVNAQFRECILCTIAPVASDSSTYVAENDAETAGCTCAVTTLPPDYDAESVGLHDVGDKWLSSQTITMQAQQAVGWELRAWIVKRVSDGQVVSSKSKGDVGFGQTFTFSILANVQVIAVSAYTLPPNQFQIRVLIKSGLSNSSGTLEIHPCGDSYVEMSNGASANVDEYSICEITAIPANGYKFVGWRVASEGSSIISTNPVYLFTVSSSAIYYAEFEAVDEEMLVLFESSSANATMRWAGKTLVSSVPVCLSSARVYADAYPVKLSIGMSDNPSHPANAGNIISSIASSQNPFRLPMRRPRKSILLEIEATDTISALCVATSMEDLKNG